MMKKPGRPFSIFVVLGRYSSCRCSFTGGDVAGRINVIIGGLPKASPGWSPEDQNQKVETDLAEARSKIASLEEIMKLE
ncbi:hypothetical protein Nepgr_017191 [Nepenthes gracilis]|uniref:Uncharacterized protein n=1 Tax=Nepenthes gracilis TaxID=150966 RepID=A0AAD3SP05_NEPGR|nr:hypothetical protein Nepgr_017191 [Nepenthes gracilis]